MNRRSLLLLFILLVFVLSLLRTARQISLGKNRLAEVKSQVNQTIEQKVSLEKEIKDRESLTYLEAEARNRLNLIKPGERIIILPKKPDGENSLGQDLAANKNNVVEVSNEPNWLKWKRLFFD